MNMKTTPTGNLSNLLNASQEYACALDDPKFREQMQGLKDVTAAIHGVASSPVVFSTDKKRPQCYASVMMQDIVGDYDVHSQVPEWAWVEREASYGHLRNGSDGIWEFVLNRSRTFDDVPEKLKPVIEGELKAGVHYIIFHQGT